MYLLAYSKILIIILVVIIALKNECIIYYVLLDATFTIYRELETGLCLSTNYVAVKNKFVKMSL